MAWFRLLFVFFGIILSPPGNCEVAIALYYGKSLPLTEFRAFDIVVVDPDHGHDPQRYQRPHSQLYAYAAVAEAHPGRAYFKDIPEAWKMARNMDWGSVVIDQTPADWPTFFADRVIAPLWHKGYRGFFLDTLDSYRLAAGFDEEAQQAGLVKVIATLHERFPGIKLILNRGFEIVPRVRDKIQMVAAESLFQGWNAGTRHYVDVPAADREWLIGQLRTIRERDCLPILAIDYLPPDDRVAMRATAEKIRQLGFTPWISDQALATVGIGAVEPVRRRILIIHDSREAPSVKFSNAHRYLEMPINHMGYIADYASVLNEIPADVHADRYAGIVTWFSGALEEVQGKKLGRWLQDKREHGIPIAVLGEFGYPIERSMAQSFNLAAGAPPAGTVKVELADAMVGFETPPKPDRSRVTPIRTTNPSDRILLALRDGKNETFTGAAITPWGGFVLDPFVVDGIPGADRVRWVINPFAFLSTALRLPPMPVPDVTTENGRRLLFSHIDGDGFPSVAEMPGQPLAAEVLYREILQKYPVPTAASVIESEVAPDGLYPKLSPRMEAVARQIFALPHVEIASHSYSHPFRWDNVRHGIFKESGEAYYHLDIPGYALDLRREITGSVDYIRRRLAPPGKPVDIMLWSGDTNPGPDALGIAQAAGLLNMNGGDTYISRSHPSLTAVGPIGIRTRGFLQIYAPITNENLYTNLWRGPFYGYAQVIDTFAMTESPRRLKPVGIYYHTYSASKPAGLKALHTAFAWAASQALHPVFASEYIRKALDFDSMAIAREGDGWRIRGDGHLRTLRLPADMRPAIDTAAGVAGFSPGREGRYLHLADDAAWFAAATAPARQPYLVDANGRLHDWSRRQDNAGTTLHFRLSAHAPLDFRLANLDGCSTRINDKPAAAGRTAIFDGQPATRFKRPDAAATIDIRCPGR
ncbi:MAG: putative signal peptide protein [Proteobacteria bacterium]|nr:putative signal peptide protein [Pseudomonadota bacterium]